MTGKIFLRVILFALMVIVPAKGVFAESKVNEIVNDFAFRTADLLIQDKNSNDGENFFFSPFSIISAFGMLYSGASGDTAIEIERALNFDNDLNKNLSAFTDELDKRRLLLSANRIWVGENFKLKNNYQAVLYHYYNNNGIFGRLFD